MKTSRCRGEQIIWVLAGQERGEATSAIRRHPGIIQTPFFRWTAKSGGMDVSDVRMLNASLSGAPAA